MRNRRDSHRGKEGAMTPLLYRLGHFCARHRAGPRGLGGGRGLGRDRGQERRLGDERRPQVARYRQPDGDQPAQRQVPQAGQRLVPIAFRAPPGDKLSQLKYKKPIQRVVKAYSKDPATTKVTGPFSEQGSSQLNKKRRSATFR